MILWVGLVVVVMVAVAWCAYWFGARNEARDWLHRFQTGEWPKR